MRRATAIGLAFAFTLEVLFVPRAWAEEAPPPVGASLGAGIATALAPTFAGAALVASGESIPVRNAGIFLMQGGLVLAPFVSHAIAREWKRAAVTTSLPLAFTIAMAAVVSVYPDLTETGGKENRSAFVVLLAGTFATSALGLVDSMLAGERWKKRKKTTVAVAPTAGGILIGGTF